MARGPVPLTVGMQTAAPIRGLKALQAARCKALANSLSTRGCAIMLESGTGGGSCHASTDCDWAVLADLFRGDFAGSRRRHGVPAAQSAADVWQTAAGTPHGLVQTDRQDLMLGIALHSSVETLIDLGTLGGDLSVATSINAHGQVVGHAQTATGELHAFRWDPDTRAMRDLGTLGGTSRTGCE